MGKHCHICKQIRNADDIFCYSCGNPLLHITPSCTKDKTHKVDMVDRFCPTCGAKTNREEYDARQS